MQSRLRDAGAGRSSLSSFALSVHADSSGLIQADGVEESGQRPGALRARERGIEGGPVRRGAREPRGLSGGLRRRGERLRPPRRSAPAARPHRRRPRGAAPGDRRVPSLRASRNGERVRGAARRAGRRLTSRASAGADTQQPSPDHRPGTPQPFISERKTMPTTHPTTRRPALFAARRRAGRAVAAVSALAFAAACAGGNRGPGESDYQANVRLSADSTLRIARTQLQLHGFTVTAAGENALVTTPRPLRPDLQAGSAALKNRQWMLRVETSRRALVGGASLRVIGYLLPPQATDARSTGPTSQPATVITSDQGALFGEVRAVAGWI